MDIVGKLNKYCTMVPLGCVRIKMEVTRRRVIKALALAGC